MSQSQTQIDVDLVKAAMMEELGRHRMDTLPMADDHDRINRRGPPHGAPSRRRAVIPRIPTRTAEGMAAAQNWISAIASGDFKDDDAAAMEGLDDLGGGRIYATRDEMVRGEAHDMMSRMDPRAIQRPELYGPAARDFRSRGQELPPSHPLELSNSHSSKLGIVLEPDKPVRTFTKPNKAQEHTFTSKSGQIIRNILHSNGSPGRHYANNAKPNTSSSMRAPAPQKGTVRIPPLTATSGSQPAKKPTASDTLLERKRQDAVFEAQVKYIKGGGIDLNKYVWAVVLLSPAAPPYMGYFILFIKKKEVYNLELNIVLNIVQGANENNNQVILNIKENEVRKSSHRLVFQDADKAKRFLKTISSLQKGGVSNVASDTPNMAAMAIDLSGNSATGTTKAVFTQASVSRTEIKTSMPASTALPPIRSHFNGVKASVTTQPTHTGSRKTETSPASILAKSDPAKDDHAGMSSANAAVVPPAIDIVKTDMLNDQHIKAKTVLDNPSAVDLLASLDYIRPDSPMGTPANTPAGIAPLAARVAGKNEHATDSTSNVLLDLDFSPPQHGNAHSSNMELLLGVDPWYSDSVLDSVIEVQDQADEMDDEAPDASSSSTNIPRVNENVAENEPQHEQEPLVQGQNDSERMHHSLVTMVLTLLAGFDNKGRAGNTPAEVNRTISTTKQTVAATVRSVYASDPSYFGNLTEDQKLQVVNDFLELPIANAIEIEDGQKELTAQCAEEALMPESANSLCSTEDTANNPPMPRKEYSPQQLLNARPNAVQPPEWLGQLDFLPPMAGRGPVIKPVQGTVPDSVAKVTVTTSKMPDPVKTGSEGAQDRPVSITTLDGVLTVVSRPATPLTPVASPSPLVVKLEHKFEKLSLEDKPEKTSSPPAVKIEKTSPTIGNSSSLADAVKPSSTLEVKVESFPPPVKRHGPLIDLAPLAERKLNIDVCAPTAKKNEQSTQPQTQAPVVKTKDAFERELKIKVHDVAAFNFSTQRKPNSATPTANNSKSVESSAVTHVAKSNENFDGQLTSPRRLNPEAAVFQPRVTNQQTGPPQQNAPSPGGMRGLSNSRWASPAMTRVEGEGKFTGLGFGQPR
ncbi:hypothetical protein BR93DRAFT_941370 [Coniochaeta sp. PMI_546]|nr:hypothetical protein BR93DRAFT_941370 [Coniochaeta sp. PMI_546]